MSFNGRSLPTRVTIVRWMGFIITAGQMWQTIAIYQQINILSAFDPAVWPTVRLAAAGGWTVGWAALTVQLWRGRPFTHWAVPAAAFFYTAYHLILQAMALSSVARQGWPRDLLLGAVAVLFIWWALRERPFSNP